MTRSTWTALAIVFVAVASPGAADTITVSKTADTNDGICDADCSLREAVAAANAHAGADEIIIPPGIYVLNLGGPWELDVNGDLTLTGAAAESTVLDGNATSRILDIAAGTVHIRHLTLRNGHNGFLGGAILNGTQATLLVEDCTLTQNVGELNGGGAISSFGPLRVVNSRIVDNYSGNQGGGIDANAALEVDGSTISDNTAFQGGGIASSTDLVLTNSTVSGNSASDAGGGVWNSGLARVENTTFSGNTGRGGGYYNIGPNATASLNNCTLVANSGGGAGGIFIGFNSPLVTVANTLVAQNGTADCLGSMTSLGYNLDDDGTCPFTAPGDLSNVVQANVAPLALNDSANATVAICTAVGVPHAGCAAASPALDAGNPAAPGSGGAACATTDERGITRPQGSACDIGAYESRCPDGMPDQCTADQSSCGDGAPRPQFGEECDDGNQVDDDGCTAHCIIEFCGDGTVQPGIGEQCEDGNAVNEDGCSATCRLEFCSDGVVQPGLGEECDDGNVVDRDGCSLACLIEAEFCGDAIRQAAEGEECDDGNQADNDGCSGRCIVEFCGDGILHTGIGEQCDDGNNVAEDGCDADCVAERCGDGVRQAGLGEECDDGNVAAGDGCSPLCLDESVPFLTLTVTKTADTDDGVCDTDCSLREALARANARPTADVIVVPPGTYPLTLGSLAIADDVTLNGGGAATTVLDGGQLVRVLTVQAGVVATVSGVTVTNGRADEENGGGILNAGTLTLVQSRITGNHAGGVLVGDEFCYFFGGCAQYGGSGGGIYSTGPLTVVDSAIDDNTASLTGNLCSDFTPPLTAIPCGGFVAGGGIFAGAALNLVNVTVSGNFAADVDIGAGANCGGILARADAVIANSTIASNGASPFDFFGTTYEKVGGVCTDAGATVTMRNSIVSVETGPAAPRVACGRTGAIVADAYNLEFPTDSCAFSGTDLRGVDPLLTDLQDNGGPTPTRALISGSPAIDAGSPALPGSGGNACESFDQRGEMRPEGPRCDIGAYEGMRSIAVGCAATPRGACLAPRMSQLTVKDTTTSDPDADRRDRFVWKWLLGPSTGADEFGDPLNFTGYRLCVYDEVGATPALVMGIDVPAGAVCNYRPCWKVLGPATKPSGYRYADPERRSNGVSKLRLVAAAARGTAKLTLTGRGAQLPLPGPVDTSRYFRQDTDVTVQLVRSDGGPCWEAVYPSAATVLNTAEEFNAK